MSLDLADVRCPHCDRLLARMEAGAIADGKVIEWKCGKCEKFLTVMGRAEDQIPSGREATRHAP